MPGFDLFDRILGISSEAIPQMNCGQLTALLHSENRSPTDIPPTRQIISGQKSFRFDLLFHVFSLSDSESDLLRAATMATRCLSADERAQARYVRFLMLC
ncbi:MAG: hypothetical protein WA728_08900 [Xanthobacteraceae bacterium]